MRQKEKAAKSVKLANGIFLAGALLCLFILAYALWRSNLHPAGVMYKYSIASVIGMILCLTALKLKENIKTNLALVGISLIFAIYIVEISLFLLEPTYGKRHNLLEKAAKKAGVPFDSRTKWQVIQDLREKGVDAYPIVFPHYLLPNGLMSNQDTIFVLGGISKKKTVLCNESGKYIIYLSDEYGFNNPPESWEAKQYDLMLIGDSFPHGVCVKPGEDIAGQLRKFGWKVLNIGMGGNGPLLELASLKEYAEPLEPKIVLWFYYEDNDFVDLQKEKNSAFLMRYLQEDFSQNLLHRQTEVNQILRQYVEKEIEKHRPDSSIVNIIKLKHLRSKLLRFKLDIDKKIFPFPGPDPLFREILKKARDRVAAWGGELYFVYLPQGSRYYKNVDHNQWRHRQEVLSIVQELEIPIIDIHQEVFLKHTEPLSLIPFGLYGHYNAKGYELVAETIIKHLKEK